MTDIITQIKKALDAQKEEYISATKLQGTEQARYAQGYDHAIIDFLPLLKLVLEQRNKYAESGRWAPCMIDKDDSDLLKLLGDK